MAGAMHPPCRRKKLRPLRPRLTARSPLCSVPSSSPHRAGRGGGPSFAKRDCVRRRVSEANRRKAAALRPETNAPCTVEERKRGGRARRASGFTHVFCPRRGASGGFGGRSKACPALLAAADLALGEREPPCGAGSLTGHFPKSARAAAAEREAGRFVKHLPSLFRAVLP